MKKLILVVTVALSLGGCAQLQQFEATLKRDYAIVTNAAVTPQQIIIAANAFDVVKATATQYLVYCKGKVVDACALPVRQKVVAYVRTGTTTRNQLETYAAQGKAGPIDLYNTFKATIQALDANTPKVAN